MTSPITNIGELGAAGGILRPFIFILERDGAVWNLNGYTGLEWRIWDLRTHTIVANNGTLALTSDGTDGSVTYTPGTSDPIHLNPGEFEARVWGTPASGPTPEPSALHRFSIGAGPPPS